MSDLAAPGAETPRRLHPVSPLLDLATTLRQAVVPLVVVVLGRPGGLLGAIALGAVAMVVVRVVAWSRFTYRLDGGSLVVESGILNRTRRVVPVDRVQQVDLQRKLRHRVLGLVVVRIDTAGGGSGPEVVLDAVDEAEATRLRALLGGRPPHPAGSGETVGGETVGGAAAPPPERDIVTLGHRRLALAGVTGPKLTAVGAAVGAVIGLLQQAEVGIPRGATDVVIEGGRPTALVVAALVAVAIPIWLAAAAGASLLADGGYRLTRRGDLLHVRRGLLDQREASLTVHRVQVVRIRQNPLRRALGMVSVTLQSAGGSGNVEGDDSRVIVPILGRDELAAVLAEVLPGAPPFDGLRSAPSAARRRAVTRRVVPVVLLVVVGALAAGPWALLGLVAVPIAALGGELAYRGLGWANRADHVIARRGGLARETVVIPAARVQSTRLVSSPFQRRSGLATLLVDVAGRGRTPAVVDGATGDLRPLCRDTLRSVSARRDEMAVRRRVAAGAGRTATEVAERA